MKWKPIVLLVLGVWIGMLIGISFVEAPLKFTAPDITLALGLGIGKIVFSALNKFEIVFSVVLLIWLVMERKFLNRSTVWTLSIVIFLIVLQSSWLLPILDARAVKIIQGQTPPATHHHFYYVGMELVKVILLIYGFIKIVSYERHSE